MIQAIIFLTSLASILMVGAPQPSVWGFIIGLAGQPFWIYESTRTRQWGILLLNICYCGAWGHGLVAHWGAW